jgi:lipoprotein-releasing system ATP-binding protein
MSNLLSVRDLYKSFVEGGEEIKVLRGVDLELKAGERLAVIGESGVGKSTLLHVLGTLDRPTAGQILYQGKEIPLDDEVALAHFRNRRSALSFSSIICCRILRHWKMLCFRR